MPTYDFRCGACNTAFERIFPMRMSSSAPECPHCGSEDTRRAYTTAPKIIMRPEGYNLHPEDPGYSHFTDLDRRVIRD